MPDSTSTNENTTKDLEHFYRVRTTSLAISIAAFLISITPENKLRDIKLFDVSVIGTSKDFLVISVITMALVSIISVALSYWHDGRDHLRTKITHVDLARSIATNEKIESLVSSLNFTTEQFSKFFSESGYVEIGNSTLPGVTVASIVERLHQSHMKRIEEISDQVIQNFPGTTLPASLYWHGDEFSYPISIAELNNTPLIAVTNTYATLQDIAASLMGATARISDLERSLIEYHRLNDISKTTHKAETTWLGILIPAAVFVIALLHAVGAVSHSSIPNLPQGIDWIVGKLR